MMALAFAFLSSGAMAQQFFSVSGTVIGKGVGSLEGATVTIRETGDVAFTDQHGMFRFEKVAPGSYNIVTTFVGFETRTTAVEVQGDVLLTIDHDQTSTITDEVVVYSTRANEKTPTAFTNVSSSEIQKQNFGQDMPFLLNWTPSLVTTSDAGAGIGYTGLRIRGSDATRINVTINGIPYNDSESQGTFWVNIPDIASSTQSVQIQRGVGTSSNGAGSFGGTVNVQTMSLQRKPYAQVDVGAGSFDTYKFTLRAGTGLINNRWAFDARASRLTSDGYIDRATSDLKSYYVSGGYYGDKTIVKAIVFGGGERTYQSWYGVDQATLDSKRTFNFAGALYDEIGNITGYYDNEVDDYKQDHYQLHLTQALTASWNANLSLHYTYGRGFYEQYKQSQDFTEVGLPTFEIDNIEITSGDMIVRRWLDNDFYGTTFSLNHEKEKVSFTFGGAYNEYANARHFGEIIWAQYNQNVTTPHQYYNGESEKKDFNVYAKLNYDLLPKLSAFVDLQYRNVTYKTAGIDNDQTPYDFSDDFNFFNPKLGLNYSLSKTDVLYASYAVANREPNRTDYIDGYVMPTSERLGDIEAGWRKKADRYSLEANYYYMHYKDQLVLTGQVDDVGNPIRANVGKSYRSGLELSAGVELPKGFSFAANSTFSVNENVDYVADEANLGDKKNTKIILSPGIIAGGQLGWMFRDLQITLLSKYVGKQYLDNTENESLILAPYSVTDFRASYTFKKSETTQRFLAVSLLVNNVFDEEYSSNGYSWGTTPYYFPQAGRNFMAMLTIKI